MSYQVLGFHLADSRSGLQTVKEKHHIFNQILPTCVEVKTDGNILINNDNRDINSYLEKKSIIPMIQTAYMDFQISNQLICNEKALNHFIKNILLYLRNEEYCEICIDIEGVQYKNKAEYTNFMKRVSDTLHQEGYSLSVVIPAKSENNQDSTWSGAYDYNSLGKIVDRIVIMAYDFHWPGGPPGPIAPLPWVQDVIDYAIIEIPPEKLYLGLGLYGYDWAVDSDYRAKGVVFGQIKEIILKHNTKVEWDQDSQSPYLIYKKGGVEHEVWFENKESIAKKIKLINDFQLKGVVFWRLGQEDPGVWQLFEGSNNR